MSTELDSGPDVEDILQGDEELDGNALDDTPDVELADFSERGVEGEASQNPSVSGNTSEASHRKLKGRGPKHGAPALPLAQRLRRVRPVPRKPKPAVVAGVDIYTQDEQEKALQRAKRFGIEEPNLVEYEPLRQREDEEQRKKRAERFGLQYEEPDLTGLKSEDILEARQEAPPEVARRPEAVHVYGVDLLSTKDLREHFSEFRPVFVEWINDSSCNVVFGDAVTAKRAVISMGKPLPPEEAPDGYGIDLTQVPFLWHRGTKDFVKDGKEVPLLFRIATVLDVKTIKEGHVTRELWKKGKRKAGDRDGGDEMEIDEEPEAAADKAASKKPRRRGGRRRKKLNNGEAMDIDEDEAPLAEESGVTDLRQLLQKRRGARHGGGRSGIFGLDADDD